MYYTAGWDDVAAAVTAAISNDADIINVSLGSDDAECQDDSTPETYDLEGVNAALRNAMNAGVLIVQATGNFHDSGDTCSASYPAWRPHVLSVGGVSTHGAETLDNAFLYTQSGRGRVPYIYNGIRAVDSVPTVGVAIKVNPNTSGVNQPLPSNVTQLKWNATVFPDELSDNGSIGFEVFDAACSSTTPWTGTHLAHDWTGSGRTRIQLTGPSIQNKCIFLVIKPYFTPGAATTTVYNAFYWHSGATGVH